MRRRVEGRKRQEDIKRHLRGKETQEKGIRNTMEYELMFYSESGVYCGSVGCGMLPPEDVTRIRTGVEEHLGYPMRCVLKHLDYD